MTTYYGDSNNLWATESITTNNTWLPTTGTITGGYGTGTTTITVSPTTSTTGTTTWTTGTNNVFPIPIAVVDDQGKVIQLTEMEVQELYNEVCEYREIKTFAERFPIVNTFWKQVKAAVKLCRNVSDEDDG